jgi:hypothetical protein
MVVNAYNIDSGVLCETATAIGTRWFNRWHHDQRWKLVWSFVTALVHSVGGGHGHVAECNRTVLGFLGERPEGAPVPLHHRDHV